MSTANLFTYFRDRNVGKDVLKPGIRIDLLEVDGGTQRSLIIGHRMARDIRRRLIVPVDFRSEPEFGRGDDLAVRGSFLVDAEGKPRLTGFSEEPGVCYVLVRLGLDPNRSVMAELGDMQRASGKEEPIKLARNYGSYTLNAGPGTAKVLGLGDDMTPAEAEEIWSVMGWKKGMRQPPFICKLWRVHPKSGVLNLNIDYKIGLIVHEGVGEKGTLKTDGAEGLRDEFDVLHEASRAA